MEIEHTFLHFNSFAIYKINKLISVEEMKELQNLQELPSIYLFVRNCTFNDIKLTASVFEYN